MIAYYSCFRTTIEGFPHITYSRINNDEINTYGKKIFGGEFVESVFDESIIENKGELKTNKIFQY